MSYSIIKTTYPQILQFAVIFIIGSVLATVLLFITFDSSEIFNNEKVLSGWSIINGSGIVMVLRNTIGVVGWTFWPLSIMATYLTIISVKNATCKINGENFNPTFLKHLEILAWVSMMIGLMGTVSALIQALQNTDLSLSIDETIGRLNISLGKALYSTLIGVALSVIAQIQVSLKDNNKDEN